MRDEQCTDVNVDSGQRDDDGQRLYGEEVEDGVVGQLGVTDLHFTELADACNERQ